MAAILRLNDKGLKRLNYANVIRRVCTWENKNKARYKAVYMRQKILIESVLKGGLLNSKKI